VFTMSRVFYQEPIDAFLKDRRIQIATGMFATVGVVIASLAVVTVASDSWARILLPLIGSAALSLAWYPILVRQRLRVHDEVMEPARRPLTFGLRGRRFQVHSGEIASAKLLPSRYGAEWYGSIVVVLDSGAEVSLTTPFISREAFQEIRAFVDRSGVKGEKRWGDPDVANVAPGRGFLRGLGLLAMVSWIAETLILTFLVVLDELSLPIAAVYSLAMGSVFLVGILAAWLYVRKMGSKTRPTARTPNR